MKPTYQTLKWQVEDLYVDVNKIYNKCSILEDFKEAIEQSQYQKKIIN